MTAAPLVSTLLIVGLGLVGCGSATPSKGKRLSGQDACELADAEAVGAVIGTPVGDGMLVEMLEGQSQCTFEAQRGRGRVLLGTGQQGTVRGPEVPEGIGPSLDVVETKVDGVPVRQGKLGQGGDRCIVDVFLVPGDEAQLFNVLVDYVPDACRLTRDLVATVLTRLPD